MQVETRTRQVRGTVLGFNLSAKGKIVGAIVETANGYEQINFPKRDGYLLARSMQVGTKIDVRAELESERDGYCISFVTAQIVGAIGKVARLNHARNGHVNGYHLEDGTFLHVRPGEAHRQAIAVGERIKASGLRRDGSDTVVFAAKTIERVGKQRPTPQR